MKHDDLQGIRRFYEGLPKRIERARSLVGRQNLTATEKLLYAHLDPDRYPDRIERGSTSLFLRPDRVAMQDATAQMAMLQFMQSGRNRVAVPSTIHCDHLIRARRGASSDLQEALLENDEVYEFLRTAAARYGIGFWKPGSGIIHQVVLEKYAFPGGLMIGTDSHTPNAGGLGMLAIGVGGADAAETMAGLPWTLRAPRLVGVRLKGRLGGWTSAKDVILYLCGKLTTSGGTNRILDYFGPGVRSLSATGRATITNMGAEMGATTSIFPFDERTAAYLRATERAEVADLAERHLENLVADAEVELHPEDYFDELVEVDLDRLEPYIVGPHSPDRARPLSALGAEARTEGFPVGFRTALIGSCTNSSYEDLGAGRPRGPPGGGSRADGKDPRDDHPGLAAGDGDHHPRWAVAGLREGGGHGAGQRLRPLYRHVEAGRRETRRAECHPDLLQPELPETQRRQSFDAGLHRQS